MNAPERLPAKTVYQAINAVQADLASVGISKSRTNSQGSGYKFRGIDDVYNTLSRLLATHGLCILPRMLSRSCEERQSKSGGALFYVTVEAEFDFVSASDSTKHTIRTFGEAMDSGDKATNKAMSAAYKYAAFQAFAIPTEGDNDADAHTHEVAAAKAPVKPVTPTEISYAIKVLNLAAQNGSKAFNDAVKAIPDAIKSQIPAQTKKDLFAAAKAMDAQPEETTA